MRFRKRLSAVILAIVMMISSIQIPGGISYAAEMADSSIESEQDVSVLTAEDTEDTEAGAKNSTDEGAITDDGNQPGNDNPTGGDSQPGNGNATDGDGLTNGDNQKGDGSPAGDDSQPDDGNVAGDDSQTGDENVSEEETDAGQISDDDAEEPELSVDTEETEEEEIKIVEAEVEGAYQFGDMPSVSDTPSASGGISAFSISTYDDSVEDYIHQQMLQCADRIDLYEGGFNVSVSDINSLMSGVFNEHPDLYFVDRTYQYAPYNETVRFLYMTYDTYDYDITLFKKKAEAAMACVTDDMSDDMKAAVLHDYLVNYVAYDRDVFLALFRKRVITHTAHW